ncbi:hypothetical protein D3C75_650410 [compost metagenome]
MHTEARTGDRVQRPHIFLHRSPVGVYLEVRRFIVMASHVHAGHPRVGQARQEFAGVVAVVAGIDEDVVDVQQQVAVGLIEYCADEVEFTHRLVRCGVVADVFHGNAPLQVFLGLANPRGHMAHRFVGEWNGHQVVQVPVITAVAQVLAVQAHLVAIEKLAGLAKEMAVQRLAATQRQRQPVAGNGKTLGQLRQALAVGTAHGNPVFRCAFQEVHGASLHGQQFRQQAAAQAKPGL